MTFNWTTTSFSIHSGDSDLIGVEDNPEFDYDGVNNVSTYFVKFKSN